MDVAARSRSVSVRAEHKVNVFDAAFESEAERGSEKLIVRPGSA